MSASTIATEKRGNVSKRTDNNQTCRAFDSSLGPGLFTGQTLPPSSLQPQLKDKQSTNHLQHTRYTPQMPFTIHAFTPNKMVTKERSTPTTASDEPHDRGALFFDHLFRHFRRVLEDFYALEMADMDDFYTWRRMHCCVTTLLLEMQRPAGKELSQGPPFELEAVVVTVESLQTTTLQENADALRQLISDIYRRLSKRTGYAILQGFLQRAHRLYYERQWLLNATNGMQEKEQEKVKEVACWQMCPIVNVSRYV